MPEMPVWIVTISGEHAVDRVAAALTKRGFVVGDVMAAIGVISGRCDESKVDALRSLPGVADIAPSTDVDVGPPGSTRTW